MSARFKSILYFDLCMNRPGSQPSILFQTRSITPASTKGSRTGHEPVALGKTWNYLVFGADRAKRSGRLDKKLAGSRVHACHSLPNWSPDEC